MSKAKLLKKGDRIFILSTARFILPEELEKSLQLFESWGLEYELGAHLFTASNQMAGNDEQRAQDLQKALDDPTIKAIVCARGGYGTVRLLDRIDFSTFQKNPKWIAGFSDVSALHLHIQSNFGIATLHAPMPITFPSNTPKALETFREILFEGKHRIAMEASPHNRNGEASGPLLGGNLSVMYSMLASSAQVDTTDCVLFLEDLDEYLYHIDRMMQAFKRAGLLSRLKALLIGGMTGMHDNTIPFGKTAKEIILETVSCYDYPVVFDVPAGHIDDNRTLILGENIYLNATADAVVLKQEYCE